MEQEHKGGNHVLVDKAQLMVSHVQGSYRSGVAAWHFASSAGLGSWRCRLVFSC
jgi:hypothetical protein